ncbi:tetratricopeptide repeat protein [Dyadobacter psychrotolerans]|uniref:Tetratricopeptide repeat protein n=1 Tax=Dyadobacter psychrotolerans TaxID=2541721 RepID=A0A4R5DYX7_9BACT|nr:tetratricopeptide repeat protein [Dyadobacter psychrotolerans]TDE17750.1 tetratricopeptide repeat protein [Dyadobacter psychrotolerans]
MFFSKSNHFQVAIKRSSHFSIILTIIVLIIVACSGQKKEDASNFFLKANIAFAQKNYTEALRLYDEAISKNSEFPDALLNKSICLIKLNRAEEAYEILTESIRMDPTLVQANLVRSEAGLLLGRFNEAEADLKQIEMQYKDSSRFYLLHGNLMEARSQTALAAADFDRAIALDKSNVEALVNRGAVYYKSGNIDLAKNDFTAALKIRPSQLEALNNLGLIAIKQNNLPEAILYFDKILNFNPADALALNNKGYALLKSGETGEAGKLIDRSLDIQPKNGYALRNMGIYYQSSGNLPKAIDEFNKAIDLAEPVEDLYGLTGIAYQKANDKESACRVWKQGIVLKDSIAIGEFSKNCK